MPSRRGCRAQTMMLPGTPFRPSEEAPRPEPASSRTASSRIASPRIASSRIASSRTASSRTASGGPCVPVITSSDFEEDSHYSETFRNRPRVPSFLCLTHIFYIFSATSSQHGKQHSFSFSLSFNRPCGSRANARNQN
jgi:hypothetical protein